MMNLQTIPTFLLGSVGAVAAVETPEEFRVTMLLLVGTSFGIAACLRSAQKEEENKMTRALIGLVGGPAVGFLLDMASPWKLHTLPSIVVAFAGMVCAVGMYFVGYAGLRKTRKNEDVALTAMEDIARKKAGLPPHAPQESQLALRDKTDDEVSP